MYSMPFQNNTFFGVGPNHNQAANVLNIQPVLPFTIGDWNIISRTITPLISLPSLTPGSLGDLIAGAASANDPFGLGDINQTFYFSPAAAKDFIWGVGPSVTLPTATTRALGSNTLAIGPISVSEMKSMLPSLRVSHSLDIVPAQPSTLATQGFVGCPRFLQG